MHDPRSFSIKQPLWGRGESIENEQLGMNTVENNEEDENNYWNAGVRAGIFSHELNRKSLTTQLTGAGSDLANRKWDASE